MKFIFALLRVNLQTALKKIERVIIGYRFDFYADGVIHWPERNTLIISDLHVGKSTHFRKNGLPLGPENFENDVGKLSAMLDSLRVEEVLLLGDVFHSTSNWEHDVFHQFLTERKEKFVLIAGNHDRHSLKNDPTTASHFSKVVHRMPLGPFLFSHEPIEQGDLFNFCGHLHPAFRLKGKGRQSIKARCFVLGKRQCILPAFGALNGSALVEPKQSEAEVLLLIGGEIHPHRLRNSATNKTSPPISL